MDGWVQAADTATRPSTALKLLFLHPKTLVDSWPFPVDTLGEIVKLPSVVYPLLAATIADLPIEAKIFDGYVSRETFAGYKRRLQWPDVIAISCMSPLKALDTEVTVKLAKRLNPAVRIVVGGNHASAWPERWIEAGVDFVITGEGELPFRRLMESLLAQDGSYADIPRLFWAENGAVRRPLTTQTQAVDLERAPLPDWRLMDLTPYGMGLGGGLGAAVEISRGCPHRCDFCNINTFWNYRQTYKSVDRVIAEIEALQLRGVTDIIFTDDNFGGNARHTVALLEEMKRRRLNIRFGCFLRGDTVARNPDFPALAAAAGMRFCMMGIETLDETWLRQHRKGVRSANATDLYTAVYQKLSQAGIFVVGLFICPPAEKPGRASGLGAVGVVCDYRMSADLMASKGSALYDQLNAAGRVAKDMFYHDWSLSSIVLENGAAQVAQGSRRDLLREQATPFALRQILLGSALARRFWVRPWLVALERLICTTRDDWKRRAIARRGSLTLQQRQDLITQMVLSDRFIDRLARRRRWKSPLTLRTGLWSGPGPGRPPVTTDACHPSLRGTR
jgi:anaerobic magnesium-protoporphyrin IX monomethyl ester cyclase